MKHAFLIIAHNNPRIFETLIGLLDFKDNDIFVHIDKKADINDFTKAKCSFSNIPPYCFSAASYCCLS